MSSAVLKANSSRDDEHTGTDGGTLEIGTISAWDFNYKPVGLFD